MYYFVYLVKKVLPEISFKTKLGVITLLAIRRVYSPLFSITNSDTLSKINLGWLDCVLYHVQASGFLSSRLDRWSIFAINHFQAPQGYSGERESLSHLLQHQ